MMEGVYNFKVIIIDFDGIFSHIKMLSKVSLESTISDCSLENILTFPELGELEDFLFSVIEFGLPVIIVVNDSEILFRRLFDSWKNMKEFLLKVQIVRYTDTFGLELERNVVSIIEKMNITLRDAVAVGKNGFFSKFEFLVTASRICLSKSFLSSFATSKSDFVIHELGEVLAVIKKGILLRSGKLPNIILRKLLSECKFEDPSIIIGPDVGEDTAAVEIRNDEVLVLKTDPITFSTDNIGYYAVLVNSNDIVTSGAVPKWMLTTLMFPPDTSIFSVHKVFKELYDTCSSLGITLCGGHTEITDSVLRPIVVGSIAGTVRRDNLIHKNKVRTGDALIMTKQAAIEGTAVIASKFKRILLDGNMTSSEINECLNLRMKISILDEARVAWENSGVSALHDVTEGGISTAIIELSKVTGYGIDVRLDEIPVCNQTKKVCDLFNINVLGLIGSGSLLICCRRNSIDALLEDIRAKDILATVIGDITEKKGKITAFRKGNKCQFPSFETDEITRLF